jgi:hypothetical protein
LRRGRGRKALKREVRGPGASSHSS